MKSTFLLSVCLIVIIKSFGQLDSSYILLIEGQMRRIQPSGTIYYGNEVPVSITGLSSGLRWSKYLKHTLLHCKTNNIDISKNDVRRFRRSFHQTLRQPPGDSLFTDSKSLPIDSVQTTVRSINRSILDSLKTATMPRTKMALELLKWEFYFSRPVYNKRRTVMLYFFMYYYNSGGEWTFYITKPGNSDWTKTCRLGGGAW